MSFDQLLKSATNNIITSTEKAISNEMAFSVQTAPLYNSKGECPPSDEVSEWLSQTVALVEPVSENLLLFLVAPSDQTFHIAILVPDNHKYVVPSQYSTETVLQGTRKIYYSTVGFPTESSAYKYQDTISFNLMQDLKKQGIYVVNKDEEEEVIVNYLEMYD